MAAADLTIRPYRPGDERQILATFNRVFREVNGPSFVDRTLEQWIWQYMDNPAGHRMSLAVAPDGTVVSQYAGVPVFVDSPWGELRFVHCVDSMTHPDWRQGLKRPGIFVVTGLPFSAYSRWIGDAVLYGFPVDSAFRIGQRYLEYHFLRVIDFLLRDPAAGALPLPAGFAIERLLALPVDLNGLYERARAGRQCLLRRDRGYLDWRYLKNPVRADYELWAARQDGVLRGLVVLKPRHSLVPDGATVADWLCGVDDDEAAAALLHAATARACAEGRTLLAVFPEWAREWRRFLDGGFVRRPSADWLERRIVFLVTGSPITAEFLAAHWWYTLGDSDLA
jgi:hypothetical protein